MLNKHDLFNEILTQLDPLCYFELQLIEQHNPWVIVDSILTEVGTCLPKILLAHWIPITEIVVLKVIINRIGIKPRNFNINDRI